MEYRQAIRTSEATTEWRYRGLAIALVILFLVAVGRFYHPGTGFTALVGFPEGHEYEAPAMRHVPHSDYPAWASYDGQFYAQRALDPLCRDPLVDRAMDLPPFRARRILFSWTAYVLGLGRPAWIINVYALQNVACWLLLAALLTRWVPPTTGRGFALWTACLFSHGLLWSVRFALLDGPSLLLTAIAVRAVERNRPVLSAAIVGLSGLARETNLFALASQPRPVSTRTAARLALAAVPRGCSASPVGRLPSLDLPIHDLRRRRSIHDAGQSHRRKLERRMALRTQPGSLVRRRPRLRPVVVDCRPGGVRSRSARVRFRLVAGRAALCRAAADHGHGYCVNPLTGAITRVLLPLTVGFNVLLASESRPGRFWPWFAAGNLHLLSAVTVMPLLPWF